MSASAAPVSLVVMSASAAPVSVLVVMSSAAALVSLFVVMSASAALVSVLVVMSSAAMMMPAQQPETTSGRWHIYEQIGTAEGLLHAVFLAKGVLGLPRQLRHGDQKYFSVEVQWFHRFSEMVFMVAKIVKAESKAARGKRSFSPRGLPRRILSYEKIGKAGSKAARENVFPAGLS